MHPVSRVSLLEPKYKYRDFILETIDNMFSIASTNRPKLKNTKKKKLLKEEQSPKSDVHSDSSAVTL